MIVPASAVGFVFSGALINVQSLELAAFSFSWHPGATGWQVRHGKLLWAGLLFFFAVGDGLWY
jgi:hypothetical protein